MIEDCLGENAIKRSFLFVKDERKFGKVLLKEIDCLRVRMKLMIFERKVYKNFPENCSRKKSERSWNNFPEYVMMFSGKIC